MEIMPDYIHILADCKPQTRLSDAIKVLDGNIAYSLFLAHPKIKSILWGGIFGTPPILWQRYLKIWRKRFQFTFNRKS